MTDGTLAKRRPFLDGWRGLAILFVLIGHFFHPPFLAAGYLGVELFFVLSGNLVARALFDTHSELRSFCYRRFSRLFPTLLVFVMLVGPLHALAGVPVPDLLAPLMFTANYQYAAGREALFFGHLWSLCIEMHAYLILAVVALLQRKWNINACLLCIIIAFICMSELLTNYTGTGDNHETLWRTDCHAGSLLICSALYLLLSRASLRPSTTRWLTHLPLVAFMIGACLFVDPISDKLRYTVGSLLLALSVNTLHFAPEAYLKPLGWRAFLLLGEGSYSIYLWQQPFYKAATVAPNLSLVLLSLAILVGTGSFYLLERPSRRLLNRVWSELQDRKSDRTTQAAISTS